jgi:hypothetical protein
VAVKFVLSRWALECLFLDLKAHAEATDMVAKAFEDLETMSTIDLAV